MEKSKKTIVVSIVAALAVIIAVIAGISWYNSPAQKLPRLLDLGEKYLLDEDYENAIATYKLAFEIDPNNTEVIDQAVSAYLGYAKQLVDSGDTDKAIEILTEGFELFGDERISAEVEKLSGSAPNNSTESSDTTEGIEKTVVDGIVHNAYDVYDINDEQAAFLDSLISLCESDNTKSAAEKFDKETLKSLINQFGSVNEAGGTIHIYYGGYKIYGNYYSSEASSSYVVALIPADEGMGYFFSNYGTSYGYGYCACSDGMFNGEFVNNIVVTQNNYEFYFSGNVVNGLYDGTVTEHQDHDMTGTFSMGRIQNTYLYTQDSTQFYVVYDSDTAKDGMAENPENYYFYLAPGSAFGLSEGSASDADGLNIYPY
ncbi:tetratricopeptide repeat protein [Pseudobutyrivibrio sp.]|uniref:tetratricopeptide repeat protein n=1 Tax=Pseudobutyrivibrio sp. TaxID=2014367 RepID=UPI001D904AB3|nr:tetratricopeptide repeat protein [Pseudobutyrivibrio sp.]MBE5909922.1 tetratricopeptide repeat protein [Pseudobutyrivibrio sp.]